MSSRRTLCRQIIRAITLSHTHRLPLTFQDVEAHHLAGGLTQKLAESLAFPKEHELEVRWQVVCAIDLAGRSLKDMMERIAEAKAKNPTMSFIDTVKDLPADEKEQAER